MWLVLGLDPRYLPVAMGSSFEDTVSLEEPYILKSRRTVFSKIPEYRNLVA